MGNVTRVGRFVVSLAVLAAVLGVGSAVVYAHECPQDDDGTEDSSPGQGQGQGQGRGRGQGGSGGRTDDGCQDTSVAPNWRDPYVPLFTLEDHEDEEERREAQRWRDEWGCDTQHCIWVKNNSSVNGGSPTSIHAGTAADHSMFEVAHQSEDHDPAEHNHDGHGGAVFADVCVTSDEGTSYEDQAGACEGPEDTQVGVVLMDHNPCGTILPYVSCTDEYHIVRPLDTDFTMNQMQNTQDGIQQIVDDPHRYLCGYGPGSENCPVPQEATDVGAGVP